MIRDIHTYLSINPDGSKVKKQNIIFTFFLYLFNRTERTRPYHLIRSWESEMFYVYKEDIIVKKTGRLLFTKIYLMFDYNFAPDMIDVLKEINKKQLMRPLSQNDDNSFTPYINRFI